MRENHSYRLKASGSLSYLDFLRVTEKLWNEAHPDIPLGATGPSKVPAEYPSILYRLDYRKVLSVEPKPRFREEIQTSGNSSIILYGQRFQNVITFTVFAQQNPYQAEQIVELFEDFMIEFQPVFKELGISELVYARRNPDGGDERPGLGVVERSVSYLVTTEKIVRIDVAKLSRIVVDIRKYLYANQATPFGYELATPNTSQATPSTPSFRFVINDLNSNA